MGKRTESGICHICGSSGPLSFEHVPPRSAFNDKPIVRLAGRDNLGKNLDSIHPARGPVSQRGVGAYTLCRRCNNDTGAWYGLAYVDWAYQGVKLMQHAKDAPSLYHIFHIFPLRVIKQIFCMFFSVNSPIFAKGHQELVRFVLNKRQTHADPSFRIFAYFNAAPMSRKSSFSATVNVFSGVSHIFSEVTFPPFGYILTVDGTSLDDCLADISFFSRYSYNEWTDVALRLPVIELYRGFPGDLRSREEVIANK
jgi:hypothetical protein